MKISNGMPKTYFLTYSVIPHILYNVLQKVIYYVIAETPISCLTLLFYLKLLPWSLFWKLTGALQFLPNTKHWHVTWFHPCIENLSNSTHLTKLSLSTQLGKNFCARHFRLNVLSPTEMTCGEDRICAWLLCHFG
jgi:hypothetical protein